MEICIQNIRNAAIELLKRTSIYTHTETFNAVNGQSIYALTPPQDSIPETILYAKYNDNPLSPVTETEIIQSKYKEHTGTPAYFRFYDREALEVVPVPDDTKEIKVKFSLGLLPTASTLPDQVFNRYFQVIADGALSKLLRMPKPWMDLNEAAVRLQVFETDLHKIKLDTVRDNGNQTGRIRINRAFL